ncbi:MAG: nucleotide pyrophosphohydrolase [Candidatus Doudnabacteria bacterium]|nr:nucleotide pyrophosphohydrolase [Candidatus Doudnabacteria bacterium]
MSDIKDLTDRIIKYRDDREWKQFHNPKDLALSLMLEAAEVAEHFQWKNKEEMEAYVKDHKEEVAEELSDVLYWVLLISNDIGVDIIEAFHKKMEQNEKKYPVDKAKGKHTKYNKL